MSEHYWSYCDHCQTEMVVCGACGNNCCNGGYGEVIGPEPGTTMDCPVCPSAYAMQAKGTAPSSTADTERHGSDEMTSSAPPPPKAE